MKWDHGCQFFRADTKRFKNLVEEWLNDGFIDEWRGHFTHITPLHFGNTSTSSSDDASQRQFRDFFGMPKMPPFYVGVNGMQNAVKGILDKILQKQMQLEDEDHSSLDLFTGTRVAHLDRDESSNKMKLYGTSGTIAFHDTSEKVVKHHQQQLLSKGVSINNQYSLLGREEGYDAVILTDISSSFQSWHRASAGVPESFSRLVQERVKARVPLFSVMIAFEEQSDIPFDTATFEDSILWFASKTNSKPMEIEDDMELKECWTLISTPEYAMRIIEETPMQDPKTGEFIPQSKECLDPPASALKEAFCKQILLCTKSNKCQTESEDDEASALSINCSRLPKIIFTDAQRWGSALPCSRLLDDDSQTRKIISGVPYDHGIAPLAPTKVEQCHHGDHQTFIVDRTMNIFQAGDMVSTLTPGFESAAISGMDAAEYILQNLSK